MTSFDDFAFDQIDRPSEQGLKSVFKREQIRDVDLIVLLEAYQKIEIAFRGVKIGYAGSRAEDLELRRAVSTANFRQFLHFDM